VTIVTILFQVLAVVVIIVAALFMLRSGGARHQAIRRILMLAFIVGAASSVFFPQVWTWMAGVVGIGRGADLLLYFLVLTFLGFVASTYQRFRHLQNDVTELSRQMALHLAQHPDASASEPHRPQ
jgi:small membrane protein